MQRMILFCSFFLISAAAMPQQLYMEIFSGYNKTSYEKDFFPEPAQYLNMGFRLAGGADHVQFGGEWHSNLNHPTFHFANRKEKHTESYYGGFIRGKISRYPAMSFGLVLRAGAGIHLIETQFEDFAIEKVSYDPILGFNGGAGLSVPVFKILMFEVGYTYYHLSRPEINQQPVFSLKGFKSAYHTFHAGLSLNLVFGERARNYRHLKENWKWRDGWRG